MGNIFPGFFFSFLGSSPSLCFRTQFALSFSHTFIQATRPSYIRRRWGDCVWRTKRSSAHCGGLSKSTRYEEWRKSQGILLRRNFHSHSFPFFYFIFVVDFMRNDEDMPTKCVQKMREQNGRQVHHVRTKEEKKKNYEERMKMTEYKIEQTHRVVQNRWDRASRIDSYTYVLCAAFISVCHFGCDARLSTNLDRFQALAAGNMCFW